MDAHKPDPAAQAGERPGTRPPEDIFSALPPEAPAPDGPDGKRSWPARIWQVLRLIFIGDAEHEQRPATGMAERLRENFSQASSAGARPMTRKELFAALDAPLHGLMPDDINYAGEVDAALSRRPAFTARALSVAVALLMAALLLWAAWAPIDEVTHAEGSVVGSRSTQSVSNLEGGILQAVLVREGEIVEKGQAVAQLENVMAESSYRDALYKLVEHRLAILRLEAMLRDEEPVFPGDLRAFLREILGEEPDSALVERARQIVEDQLNTWRAQSSKLQAELSMLEAQYAQRQSEVAEQLARKKQLDGSLVLETEQRDTTKRLLLRNNYSRMDYLGLEQKIIQTQGEIDMLAASIPKAQAMMEEARQRIGSRVAEEAGHQPGDQQTAHGAGFGAGIPDRRRRPRDAHRSAQPRAGQCQADTGQYGGRGRQAGRGHHGHRAHGREPPGGGARPPAGRGLFASRPGRDDQGLGL